MEILSDLILPGNPDQPLEPATKQYVDAASVGGASEITIGGTAPTVSGGLPEFWVDETDTADQGITICTSTSRPVSPINGTFIYETDTKLRYFYDTGQWYLQGEQAVARHVLPANSTNMTCTIPVVTNGWKLRIDWYVRATADCDAELRFNGDAGATYYREWVQAGGGSIAAGQNPGVVNLGVGTVRSASGSHWVSGSGEIMDAWNTATGLGKNGRFTHFDVVGGNTIWMAVGGFWVDNISPYRIGTVQLYTNPLSASFITGSQLICYARSTLG